MDRSRSCTDAEFQMIRDHHLYTAPARVSREDAALTLPGSDRD